MYAGPTQPAITGGGGEKGNTLLHNELTDGGTFTHTHTQAQTKAQTSMLCTDTVPNSYLCCCALYTQRGCQLTVTHLYSVMIMQRHTGSDYAQVSEGKIEIEMRALKVGTLM